MKQIEKASDVRGLWAAVPTPWTAEGKLAEDTLIRNVQRHAQVPMDGVYTTDSDGEFYALELDDFGRLARALARAAEPTPLRVQMGVTWCSTRGIIDRIKAALDVGINCFHVGYPFWMPLAPSDVQRFWADLAEAAPRARWIHYNTSRGHIVMRGADYARLAGTYPQQMLGSKLTAVSMPEILEFLDAAPGLSHFITDYAICPGLLLGASGNYSYWANTLPHWTRRLVDTAMSGDWNTAAEMQKRLILWEQRHTQMIRQGGHLHGIVGKARGALTGFLEDTGYTQPPYYPVSPEVQARYKAAFDQYWKGET